ncbi:unnamed protein product [Allacma fusca]|uniref:Peptidase M14 domain-containing protein n=1 Tax=Allacma fusca TaxID=39272 RepID=A0A8J2NVY7_9HEXA|nr:unnamed protein product [Allacma fusca]
MSEEYLLEETTEVDTLEEEGNTCVLSDNSQEEKEPPLQQPEDWWKNFVRVIEQSSSELKIAQGHDTSPFPDKSLEWAVSVGSQILTYPANDSRKKILNFVANSQDGICNVMKLLEESLNCKSCTWLSHILRECANPRNGSIRLNTVKKLMESEDSLDAIIRMLASLQSLRLSDANSQLKPEFYSASVNLIWLLSAMAEKDANFVMKLRTMSKVKFLHSIMKTYFFGKSHTHYPLLKIFRALARNQRVSVILGKDKIMKLFVRIFNTFNNQPSTKFLLVFDVLNQLTKSQDNCRRFLKAGLLVFVIRAFSYWSLWKGNGLLKLSKKILSIYSHLAAIRAGRKVLVQTDALLNLKKFCETCPNERAFDNVIMKAAGIIYVAYQKDALPFEDIHSPARFDIPKTENSKYDKDSGSSSDEDDPEDLDEVEDSDDGGVELEEQASNLSLRNDLSTNDDLIITDDDQSTVSVKTKSKSKKVSQVTGLSQAKGDCQYSAPVNSTGYPPEVTAERLSNFATFFRELDGHIANQNKDIYSNSLVQHALRNYSEFSSESHSLPKSEMKCFWLTDHPNYGDPKFAEEFRSNYLFMSNRTRSVLPFVKVAYPDLVLCYGTKRIEYINTNADRTCLRSKLLAHISRASQELFRCKVVYDLDALVKQPEKVVVKKNVNKQPKAQPAKGTTNIADHESFVQLSNDDEEVLGSFDGRKEGTPALAFESRFESGNLRKAIQVGEREYDLYLMSDVNSNRHNQWFYFQVSNTQENCPYTFNIMNCIKGNSQFNYGMQPVVFSVGDAVEGKVGWYRSGSNICYFRNGHRNLSAKKKLLTELVKLLKHSQNNKRVLVRYDVLCDSLNHNEVPLLTVTAPNDPSKPIELREVIFLTSRVHPGESNSSWVMHGVLHNLLSGREQMDSILQRYVFKIIPMLNVEGVINGCHRCGLTNEDLNRRWKNPDPVLHPSIFNAKGLIEFSVRVRNKTPVLFCDLHGHSRKKNVFFYGCSRACSWHENDRAKCEDPNVVHLLPEALARRNPAFALSSCNFEVRKGRESTARVCMWREFGIIKSYTLESSYCGCDRGPFKGLSLGIHHLIEVGESLCEAVEEFYNRPVLSISEYSLTSPQNPTNDPSSINLCNLEDPRYIYGEIKQKRLRHLHRKRISGTVKQMMNGTKAR